MGSNVRNFNNSLNLFVVMCKQCNLKPVYEFTNKKKLCKGCFIKYFQKKFLYTIRKFDMIKKGDVVSYKSKGGFRDVVLEDLLNLFVNKGVISVMKVSNKKANKIALSNTLDIESDKIVHILIKNNASKLKKLFPVDKKIIKPLYLLTDDEILLYAKLRNLKIKSKKTKKDKISSFIDELEKKHPEIKRAIVNSYLELYEK